MTNAPAIIVHSLEHMTASLAAAEEHARDVILLSAPHAAASMGAGVYAAMAVQAHEAFPKSEFIAALGCNGDAGHALSAIRSGLKAIVLSKACPAYERIRDVAAQNDVLILDNAVYGNQGGNPSRPLDLAEHSDPLAACREFLHT